MRGTVTMELTLNRKRTLAASLVAAICLLGACSTDTTSTPGLVPDSGGPQLDVPESQLTDGASGPDGTTWPDGQPPFEDGVGSDAEWDKDSSPLSDSALSDVLSEDGTEGDDALPDDSGGGGTDLSGIDLPPLPDGMVWDGTGVDPQDCETAEDCDDGSVCTYDGCLPGVGCFHKPVSDGTPCGDLPNHICIGGICQDCVPACNAKECGPNGCGGVCGECGDGESCINGLCFPGGGVCTGDSSCPPDHVCKPVVNSDVPNTLITKCGPPVGQPLPAGENCSWSSECQSGICTEIEELGINTCWGACQTDEDCPLQLHCYPNRVIFIFDQGTSGASDDKYYSLPGCTPYLGSYFSCDADTDCPAGEFCSPYANITATAFEPYCVLPFSGGTLPAGSTCAADNQCMSNDCMSTPHGKVCVGLCDSNAGCHGQTSCQDIVWEVNGHPAPVKVCGPQVEG